MRTLALAALLTLAACDDSRLIEPTISNGNRLESIDCDAASPDNDTVCVVNEDETISVEPDHERQAVE